MWVISGSYPDCSVVQSVKWMITSESVINKSMLMYVSQLAPDKISQFMHATVAVAIQHEVETASKQASETTSVATDSKVKTFHHHVQLSNIVVLLYNSHKPNFCQ